MNKLLSGGGGGVKRNGFGSSTPSTFLALTDTPNSYATKGTNVLQVNAAENAVEFVLGRGVANGFASLDASGLLPTSQHPPLAISDVLGTVGNQVDMLALVGQNGDWCIRSDLNTVWIVTAVPSSAIGNWQQMVYPGTLAHAFGGGSHLADTVANTQTKLSDGSLITSKPGEISAIAAKAVPTTADFLLIEDAADSDKKKRITIATIPAAAPAAHDLAGALHNADTITNLNLKLSDGDVISTKAGEIAAIANKAVPTTADMLLIEDAADTNKKKMITLANLFSSSDTDNRYYNFSMPQQAQATLGKFSKAAHNNNNEMLYTTDQANAGIQNGQIDPYICPSAMTIKAITVTLASIAVSQATVGAGPVIMRIDVYRNDFSTRTLLGTISVPIDRTKCGVNNGLGLNCFQTITVTGLSIAVAQGNTWGIEFLNVSTNNNCINSALGVYAVVTAS